MRHELLRRGRLRGLHLAAAGAWMCAACGTHGPEVPSAGIEQALHVPGTLEALVVVRHEVLRRPTGLGAFPDGGRVRWVSRGSTLYRVDARTRTATPLLTHAAGDDMMASYNPWVVGLEGDSVAWFQVSGCPREGGCTPNVETRTWSRVELRGPGRGSVTPVDRRPPDLALPGVMVARRPGERSYMRVSADAQQLRVRFEESGPPEPLMRVERDGALVPVER